jgi:hypothetical protein
MTEQYDSVRSCAERVQNAARILAVGAGSLHERLDSAALTIGILEPKEFPRDLRTQFTVIHEAITAHGDFESSVRHMTEERARSIAEEIWNLSVEVARRDAVEELS